MNRWNGATLFLRPDLSEAEAKAIIEEAKHLSGSEQLHIKTRGDMACPAILQNQYGEGKILDSKLSQWDVSYNWSMDNEDNQIRLIVRIGKIH